MDILRKVARQAATSFKDIADDVWDEVGDAKGVSQLVKGVPRSAGKYALTSQLLMAMNFPDEAPTFQHSFNITNDGPTGSVGFQGTPIGHLLDSVAEVSQQRNASAIGIQGYAEAASTSTIDDLGNLLPKLRAMANEGAK